ncbi:hypothetical protein [Boseongicola aestuarii]|uniref:Uncharacterized protein n=1 Tax=Boseongicola aestuarii TaxID=1470561 RepID=A0A238J6X6_9RHOB|nr:hypothetical protein [Boseongicola aestuarii]SMX25710.1 hypothetical protein BOA8489_03854 [Boseongicola aestuarii]
MVKLIKTTAFKSYDAKPESQMDKTTRIVREMMEVDAEQRQAKRIRLRNARLEREAHTPPETPPKAKRKPGATKTVKRP